VWYQSVCESVSAGILHRKAVSEKFQNHGTTLWKLKKGLGNAHKAIKVHNRDIVRLYSKIAGNETGTQRQIRTLFRENADLKDQIEALREDVDISEQSRPLPENESRLQGKIDALCEYLGVKMYAKPGLTCHNKPGYTVEFDPENSSGS